MKESTLRFYRVLLNLFSSLSRSMVGLILGVFATPIILRCLGEEQFGAYRVLLDWTAQLGLLEFGLFPSLQAIFAKSLNKSSKIDPRTVSREAFKKYLSVLCFQVIGIIFIALFLKKLIPVSPELEGALQTSLLVMSISLLFVFSQIYRAYLDASQRGYIVSTLMIVQNIVFVILSLILAVRGFGISGQAAAYVTSLGISFLFLFLKSRKYLPKYEHIEKEKKGFSLSLKEQRTPQFVGSVCGRASLLLDNMIIAAFLGAKTVTAFYLTQRLISLATQQLQQIGNATWPAMTELYFSNDTERFKERVIEVTQLIAFACGAVLAPLCFLNGPFVQLWTGANTFAGLVLTSIVIYNGGLIAIITFWQWCFAGTGLIRKITPCLVAQAVVNVSASLILTKTIGITGPVLGTLISFQFITIPWQTYLMKETFEVPIWPLLKAWVIPFVIPVATSVIATQFVQLPEIESWPVFMIGSFTLYLICGFSFLYLFLPKKTRSRVFSRIQKLMESRLGKISN